MEKLRTFPGQRSLPTSYVNDIALDRNKRAIADTMKAANEALQNLHQLACKSFGAANDRSNWPKDWHDLTTEWLQSHIAERLQALDAMPFTDTMLDRIKEQWQDTEDNAKKWLQALDKLRDLESQGAEIQDGDRHKLICKNADAIAAVGTEYPIGDEPRELWRLIQNLRSDWMRIESYAKKLHLKEPRISDYISKDDPDSFARSWAFGLFTSTPSPEQERNSDDFLYHSQDNAKPSFTGGRV